MSLWNQLLLNMLLIITPILMYQVFWIDRPQPAQSVVNRPLIGACCALMALLCMAYPFELTPGFIYDFRMIPFALCFLYLGPRYALGTAGLLLAYRIYLGGAGVYATMITLVITILVIHFYKRLSAAKRTGYRITLEGALLGAVLGLAIALVFLLMQLYYGQDISSDHLLYFSFFIVTHSITMGLAAYLIERIYANLQFRKQVQHNEKMHVLSELAASFAHEIRNPMTVARGFVQMMNQQDLDTEKRQIYTQMIMEEMDRTQSIIDDYLSFARPQLDAISLVDAKQLILEATESLKTYAELRGVQLELQLQDRLMISANAAKFMQCITNLCKNGIEAMPSGGLLQIVGSLQSQTVCIDIIDQGVGMSEEEISRLGNPFYATRGKGTGLGMMVTYRVIQNIQGRIDVTSEVGRGTCFSILIPSLYSSSYH